MKVCTKCKIEKSLDCYTAAKGTKDGLRHTCKECRSAESKADYEKNKEKRLVQCKIWADANPEKKRAATKKWAKTHPEKVKAKNKENWQKKDKEVENAKMRKYRTDNPDKAKHYNRNGAKRSKKWRDKNPEMVNYQAMNRYADKLQATPKWLTEKQINHTKQFYKARKST